MSFDCNSTVIWLLGSTEMWLWPLMSSYKFAVSSLHLRYTAVSITEQLPSSAATATVLITCCAVGLQTLSRRLKRKIWTSTCQTSANWQVCKLRRRKRPVTAADAVFCWWQKSSADPAYWLSSPTLADIDKSTRGLETVVASSGGYLYVIESLTGHHYLPDSYPLSLPAAVHTQVNCTVIHTQVNCTRRWTVLLYTHTGELCCYTHTGELYTHSWTILLYTHRWTVLLYTQVNYTATHTGKLYCCTHTQVNYTATHTGKLYCCTRTGELCHVDC